MFGYIHPDVPWLFKKDETLYKALYCGLCKSIGKGCGQCPRTALTYDMSFVSALAHNIRGEDVIIEKRRCVLHWFRRRPIAKTDGLTIKIGYINTILAYYKLCDDKADGEPRGALRHLYKGGFKRARKAFPAAAEIIEEYTQSQALIEKKNCAVMEEAAEPTAVMMAKLSDALLEDFATPHTQRLFYELGKWVYLIDALDDYDKDVKRGGYNVIFNTYHKNTKTEAVSAGREELEFIFNSAFAGMRQSLKDIKFYFNHDLTDNIILRGIPLKSREIVYGKQCAKEKGVVDEQKKS